MTVSPSFLGRGFAFPFRLNAQGSAPEFTDGEQLVQESINAIFSTSMYERPFRVKNGIPYGVNFINFLFNNIDAGIDVAHFEVKQSLQAWEPRIDVLDVNLERAIDTVSRVAGIRLTVSYKFRATNRSDNFVRFFASQL